MTPRLVLAQGRLGRGYESPIHLGGGCTKSAPPDAEGGQKHARIERAMSSLNGQNDGPLRNVNGRGESVSRIKPESVKVYAREVKG